MTLHFRDFELAHSTRWNRLHCSTDARNILNRNIQLEGVFLHTEVNQGAPLLTDAKIELIYGRKYGLVGRNGVGKTTLLKALADHKIMGIYDHQRILYVDDGTDALQQSCAPAEQQQPESKADIQGTATMTVMEYLLAQHKDRIKLQEQLVRLVEESEEVLDVAVYEHVVDELKHLDDASTEARAAKILAGLGLDAAQPMQELSGGWRHRVALATALFLEPDVLLLDEPTTHLDLHAVMWLEEYLDSVKSTVVVVTHDFGFLDSFATHMIAMEKQQLFPYLGNFSAYVATKQQKLQKQRRMFKTQEAKRRRLEEAIQRLQQRAQASPTGNGFGNIRSMQQLLKHRLGASLDGVYWKYCLMGPRPEVLAPDDEEPFDFDFATDVSDIPEASGEQGTVLLAAKDIGFSYASQEEDPKWVFRSLNFTLTTDTRLGIVGQNGTGKSTILKVLTGQLEPVEGSIIRWCGLRCAYFAQHVVKSLTYGKSALSWLLVENPGLTTDSARDCLGRLGLIGVMAEETPVRVMSDGQRARVVFASLLAEKPHLLFLDEPTSHLDAETVSALTAAISTFEGGVIVASHDRTFLAEVTTERMCLDPQCYGEMTISFDEYKRIILNSDNGVQKEQDPTSNAFQKISAVEQHNTTQAEKEALGSSSVKCRHCGEGHFSHSCPNKTGGKSLGSFEASVQAHRDAFLSGANATESKSKAVLPPTKEKAADGNGDWNVAISKSTRRRIERQAR